MAQTFFWIKFRFYFYLESVTFFFCEWIVLMAQLPGINTRQNRGPCSKPIGMWAPAGFQGTVFCLLHCFCCFGVSSAGPVPPLKGAGCTGKMHRYCNWFFKTWTWFTACVWVSWKLRVKHVTEKCLPGVQKPGGALQDVWILYDPGSQEVPCFSIHWLGNHASLCRRWPLSRRRLVPKDMRSCTKDKT